MLDRRKRNHGIEIASAFKQAKTESPYKRVDRQRGTGWVPSRGALIYFSIKGSDRNRIKYVKIGLQGTWEQ